jgi:hypothetical protein
MWKNRLDLSSSLRNWCWFTFLDLSCLISIVNHGPAYMTYKTGRKRRMSFDKLGVHNKRPRSTFNNVVMIISNMSLATILRVPQRVAAWKNFLSKSFFRNVWTNYLWIFIKPSVYILIVCCGQLGTSNGIRFHEISTDLFDKSSLSMEIVEKMRNNGLPGFEL